MKTNIKKIYERVGRNTFSVKYKKQVMIFNSEEIEELKSELINL